MRPRTQPVLFPPPFTIAEGDALEALRQVPDACARTCVTSPPYWKLRDYGHQGQIGQERSPEEFVERVVEIMREVRRVLTPDGTLWLNVGDSYAGRSGGGQGKQGYLADRKAARLGVRCRAPAKRSSGLKCKDLVGIPWRLAFALQADGWWLRQDIIWAKPSPMPESVRDRCTKAHEYLFLLSKSERYYFDPRGIQETAVKPEGSRALRANPGPWGDSAHSTRTGLVKIGPRNTRNKRSVWTVASQASQGDHFAAMPEALARPPILAGSARGDLVVDPFAGTGTTGLVAVNLGRRFWGAELVAKTAQGARERILAGAR